MRQGKILIGTVLSLLLIAASASAEEKIEEQKNPWRGSALTYEHTFSAISLDKSYEPMWNPYYAHQISLRPEWHFTDDFFARARFDIEQELTLSDDTTYKYQWMWNDLRVDAGYAGYKEETTGIKVSGDIRFVFPTSRAAQASNLLLGVAPAVNLGRKFDVMQGLRVGYGGRLQLNYHSGTGVTMPGTGIVGMASCREGDTHCEALLGTGMTNASHTLQHGPTFSFSPIEKLEFSVMMSFFRTRLYDIEDYETDIDNATVSLSPASGTQVRYANFFAVEAAYQVLDFLGLSLGMSTYNPQLKPDSTYRTPFINRYTTFMLDMNIDVDAVYSKI